MNEVASLLQENKKIKSARYVSTYEGMFACPVCKASMKVTDYKSLICINHHTFDFAKQGYLNLTTNAVKNTKYSKDLFEARSKLITKGAFYQPLHEAISNILNKHFGKSKDKISILDMGCGEGSHLSTICEMVRSNFSDNVLGVGVDISKEGIMVAAKNYSNKIWTVADLANTPFKDHQFDVILNILSPSNYGEFNRLLKPDGIVIKIVPQSGYLQELREHLFPLSEKQTYSNSGSVERFTESYECVDHSRLTYKMNLPKPSIEWLVKMTPLTWSTSEERVHSYLQKDCIEITVDFDILIGRNQIINLNPVVK